MGDLEWVRVTRDDGETVGWIEPLDLGYESLQPRDVLGHPVGEPCEWVEAEERLQEKGLAHLAQPWWLDGAPSDLAVIEVSPHGILLAGWLETKALVDSPRHQVVWPDVAGRLSPAASTR